MALTIKSEGGCDAFSPADEEESFEREEEEAEDSGKPQCSCCEKAMSFARRLEGEMTLLVLSTRIVLRMMAGSRASFDVLVNLTMTPTRPPGGGWLSMKGDDWQMLSSLIQTEPREATAEMEPDAIPKAAIRHKSDRNSVGNKEIPAARLLWVTLATFPELIVAKLRHDVASVGGAGELATKLADELRHSVLTWEGKMAERSANLLSNLSQFGRIFETRGRFRPWRLACLHSPCSRSSG